MLGIGFLGVILAFAVAHASPATEYELSIYGSTPLAFWVGVGLALSTALIVSLRARTGYLRLGAGILASSAVLSVVGLPILRGYYFYGAGDSLSHLGYARRYAAGTGSPFDLLHPGIHLVTVVLGQATSLGLTWSFMATVVAFFLAFLVFVPLLVGKLSESPRAWTIGTFSAVLLLPINNVSVHPVLHPISQGILVFPFVLYVLFEYVTDSTTDRDRIRPTPVGGVLALTSVALVLIHPQQALNVILVLGTVAVVQFLARRYRPQTVFADHRRVYGQAAFAIVAFFLWAPRNSRFQNAMDAVFGGLFGGAPAGDEIQQRSASLLALQGSIEELFVKLFLVSLVFSVVAGAFMLAVVTRRIGDENRTRDAMVAYMAFGMVPLFGLFLAFFASSYTTQPFRYLGAMMAIVTVVGAVAFAYGERRLRERFHLSRVGGGVALAVFFALVIPLSMVAVHPSPYIFQNSAQVTEDRMSGYGTAFEIRDVEVPFTGVRGGPDRYVDAHYGTRSTASAEFPGKEADVPGAVFDEANYTSYYDGDRYLVVTNADRKREIELYDGFRYSERGFEALASTPDVNRVHSNGQVSTYLFWAG